jgi:hypothetical protein
VVCQQQEVYFSVLAKMKAIPLMAKASNTDIHSFPFPMLSTALRDSRNLDFLAEQ